MRRKSFNDLFDSGVDLTTTLFGDDLQKLNSQPVREVHFLAYNLSKPGMWILPATMTEGRSFESRTSRRLFSLVMIDSPVFRWVSPNKKEYVLADIRSQGVSVDFRALIGSSQTAFRSWSQQREASWAASCASFWAWGGRSGPLSCSSECRGRTGPGWA